MFGANAFGWPYFGQAYAGTVGTPANYAPPSAELIIVMNVPEVSPEQFSMAMNIDINTPTIISGSPVLAMAMRLGMFIPIALGPQLLPSERMVLGMIVPGTTPSGTASMALKIGMNVPTVTPYAVPSMKLALGAKSPSYVSSAKAPATMILNLLADAPETAFASFLILSGILRLGMFIPTILPTPVEPPPGPGSVSISNTI